VPVTRTKPAAKTQDEMQLSLLAGAGREGRGQGLPSELRDELTVLLAELKRLQAALRGDA
jgi:hypothetical protein